MVYKFIYCVFISHFVKLARMVRDEYRRSKYPPPPPRKRGGEVKVSFELKGDKQIYHDIIKSIWLKEQYQKALDAVLCDLIGSEPDLSQITSGDVLLELEAIRRRIKLLRSGKPNTDNGCQSGQ